MKKKPLKFIFFIYLQLLSNFFVISKELKLFNTSLFQKNFNETLFKDAKRECEFKAEDVLSVISFADKSSKNYLKNDNRINIKQEYFFENCTA